MNSRYMKALLALKRSRQDMVCLSKICILSANSLKVFLKALLDNCLICATYPKGAETFRNNIEAS